MHTFNCVETILTGAGCFSELGRVAKRLGKRAMAVHGAHAEKTGVAARAKELLRAEGIDPVFYTGIKGEPTDADVDVGRKFCRENKCEFVIAIGGGSVLDASKAIAALANAPLKTHELFVGAAAEMPEPLPWISVPTTSGSGSEVTRVAVISCPDITVKAGLRAKGMFASAAIVDYELTLTCPKNVTASAGIDALTQAIESFVSLYASPLTDALSFRSAELLLEWLPRAYRDGSDRAAREACSYASLMAGMAFTNSRLGIVHGIAHPLGIRYHIPHGVACGLLLPPAIRFNKDVAREKFAKLSAAAGMDIEQRIITMLDELALPANLSRWKVSDDDIENMARESMPSGSLQANPRKVTEQYVINILRELSRK